MSAPATLEDYLATLEAETRYQDNGWDEALPADDPIEIIPLAPKTANLYGRPQRRRRRPVNLVAAFLPVAATVLGIAFANVGGPAPAQAAVAPVHLAPPMWGVPQPRYDAMRASRPVVAEEAKLAAIREAHKDRRQAAEARQDQRQEAQLDQQQAAQRRAQRAQQAAAPVQAAASGPVSISGMSAYEQCVIEHESGGNPRAVNPSSGAGGLFQFLPSTWAGLGYSGLPQDAPVAEQEQAFQRLYAEAGSSPWITDGCG